MIILASQSHIRRQLLERARVQFVAQPSSIDENHTKSLAQHLSPAELAQHLAIEKAKNISKIHATALVIGADQTLQFQNNVFNKATSIAEARQQLMLLRGQSHQLHTSNVVAQNNLIIFSHLETTTLTMRNFSDEFAETYLQRQGDAITSSVGAYKLEEEGINLFTSITGDYFSILGLSLMPLLAFLREIGEIPS
jgi:septum formation protein